MGMGAFPSSHPYFMGMVGMHGTRFSNYAVSNCDVLIAVGARFSDRVVSKVEKFAPNATIIHIDIDPAEIGKNVNTHIPVCGDVKKILEKLMDMVDEKAPNGWNKQIEEWKKAHPVKSRPAKGKLTPQFILRSFISIPRGMPSSVQRWARTKCGPLNSIDLMNRGHLSPRADWVLWDMVWGLLSAPVSADPTGEL